MKKIIYYLTSLFLLFWLVLFFLFPEDTKKALIDTMDLWLRAVVVSIVPIYIICGFLVSYPLVSRLLYPILKKFMHFENQKACSLFCISILTGNPTTTILIKNAYLYQEISLAEANRLLRFTSHLSPLFILFMAGTKLAIILIMIQIIASVIIAIFAKPVVIEKMHIKHSLSLMDTYSDIIQNCPNILLTILMTMLFVTLLRIPFHWLQESIPIPLDWLNYPLALLEITTGFQQILQYQSPFLPQLLFLSVLLSLNGGAILLQVYSIIKNTKLRYSIFIKYRIIHAILTGILCFVSYLFIFCC